MNNYYKMNYDMETYDELLEKQEPYIYSDTCNIGEIEVKGVKKGFFNNIILKNHIDFPWPRVEFYYDSKESNKESDFLGNVARWPIVHKNVMDMIISNQIQGISFFPVYLIDNRTKKVNLNYYLLFIHNFIDAFDMEKSQYMYNQKFDFYTFIPKKTFINTPNCLGYDIFRADKSPSMMFVSEKLKTIIEESRFTGFAFSKQE